MNAFYSLFRADTCLPAGTVSVASLYFPRTGGIHILPPPYAHSWEDASLTLEDEA